MISTIAVTSPKYEVQNMSSTISSSKPPPPPRSRKPNRIEAQQNQEPTQESATIPSASPTQTQHQGGEATTPTKQNEERDEVESESHSLPNIVVIAPPTSPRTPSSTAPTPLNNEVQSPNSPPPVKVTDVLDRRLGTAPILGAVRLRVLYVVILLKC
jgi:hypothetical protein